ncbi:MAG TPA: L,D-transpeptidase [Rhodothermales bacterium]|nr:L,D-transpeptidase [Rhodothermales bacterium]
MRTVLLVVLLLSSFTWVSPASAQTFINQQAVEQVLAIHSDKLEDIPEVYYDYYDLYANEDNSVLARNDFYGALGMGDMEKGSRRARLVELLNRIDLAFVEPGDTLVVPDTFGIDFRAYSPFPRYYEGAKPYDKLFIIHKTVQAWAAYEHGELARWGVVSTGKPESPTPTGRFNFNWKEPYRISELSPPDEDWEMYWVFNFNNERGIHIHQYDMPTDGPTSHGCVRLVDADARWIFDWAEAWTVEGGGVGYSSSGHKILKQGTMVLVLGEDPGGKADLFDRSGQYPVIKQVELPDDPLSVPPGTDQQRRFDRLRRQSASASGTEGGSHGG